jgi:outer membrane protein assembly factor BamB
VVVVLASAEAVGLNATDGKVLWRKALSSESLAIPAVHKNAALLHTLDGKIVALDANNGTEFWRYSYAVPTLVLRKFSTPVMTDDSVVVGLANGKLVELATSGEILWMADISDYTKAVAGVNKMVDISAEPVVMGDSIYAVGYQGKLVALAKNSGQLLWSHDASSLSGLAVNSGKIFLTDEMGHVFAFAKDGGKQLWVNEDLEGRQLSKPLVVANNVVVTDSDGNVHWFDSKSGEFVGRHSVGGSITATPILAGNTLYVLDKGGKVAALQVQ